MKVSIDLSVAMTYVQDDMDLLARLVSKYLAVTVIRIQEIEQAVTAGDLEAARRIAHTMKGSSAYVGAMRMTGLAENMESVATLGDAVPIHKQMQAEYALLATGYQEALGIDLLTENP